MQLSDEEVVLGGWDLDGLSDLVDGLLREDSFKAFDPFDFGDAVTGGGGEANGAGGGDDRGDGEHRREGGSREPLGHEGTLVVRLDGDGSRLRRRSGG